MRNAKSAMEIQQIITGLASMLVSAFNKVWNASEVVIIVPKPVTALTLIVIGTDSVAAMLSRPFKPFPRNSFQKSPMVRRLQITRQGTMCNFSKLKAKNSSTIGMRATQKLGFGISGVDLGSNGCR